MSIFDKNIIELTKKEETIAWFTEQVDQVVAEVREEISHIEHVEKENQQLKFYRRLLENKLIHRWVPYGMTLPFLTKKFGINHTWTNVTIDGDKLNISIRVDGLDLNNPHAEINIINMSNLSFDL